MKRISDPTSALTGIFLVLVACLAFYLSRSLSSFTDVGLGPGFVPRAIALLQLVMGCALVLFGMTRQGEPVEGMRLRPFLVLASIAFFALSIERLGLVAALSGLILLACAAHPGTRPRDAVLLAAGTSAASVLIFVKALGLTIPVWPPGF